LTNNKDRYKKQSVGHAEMPTQNQTEQTAQMRHPRVFMTSV